MDNYNQGYNVNGYSQNNQYGYNANTGALNYPKTNGYPVKQPQTSHKSKVLSLLLCMFLGVFGIHRFYLGKVGTGIIWLLTGGCCGFGVIIDFIRLCNGSLTVKSGLPLKQDITKDGSDCLLRFMVIYYIIAFVLCFAIWGIIFFTVGITGINKLTPPEPIDPIIYEPIATPDEPIWESEPIENEPIDEIPIRYNYEYDYTVDFLKEDGIYENSISWRDDLEYDFEPYPHWDTGLYTGKLVYNSNEIRDGYILEQVLNKLDCKDFTDFKELLEYDDFYVDYYGKENKPYLYNIHLESMVVSHIDTELNEIILRPKLSNKTSPKGALEVVCKLFPGTTVNLVSAEKISVGDTIDVMGNIVERSYRNNSWDEYKSTHELYVYTLSIYG